MTTKDKTVPFITANHLRQFIQDKKAVNIYKVKGANFYVSLYEAVLFFIAYLEKNRKKEYSVSRYNQFAKRLEREFLRKEEKEKENKPLDGNNFTTIVMIDYSNEQLEKSATENLESLVNSIFEDYTWLRGDIALSHFEAIRKSFSDQFSGFGEETFLEHFNQGEGDYFFKTTFHCTEECETWYEFELIDFKPLEEEVK